MTATLHLDRKNENSPAQLQAVAFLQQNRSPTTPASPAFCGNMDMRTNGKKEEDILVRWISLGYQSLQANCPESTSPKPRNSHSVQSNFPPGFSHWRVGYRILLPSCKNQNFLQWHLQHRVSWDACPSPCLSLKSLDPLPCISEKFTMKISNIQEYSITNSQVSIT